MKLRAAVIGCGRIGSAWSEADGVRDVCTHAAAYAACPDAHLVAVCDADGARAAACGEFWGVDHFTDPGCLFAEAHPEVVSVCTPDSTHFAVVQAALRAGGIRAILAEKPLATRVADAQELVALARWRGVVLAVNYSRRYAGRYAALREFVAGGGIGAVRLVRGLYGKGTLHNGTHWLDLARFLVGEVTQAHGRDRLCEGGDDPTLDVSLDFAGGAAGELLACSEADFTAFEMDVLGTTGRIRLTDCGNTVEVCTIADGVPRPGYRGLAPRERSEGVLRDLPLRAVEDVIACVRTRAVPCCTGTDGVRALEIAAEARRSAGVDGAGRRRAA